MTDKPTIVDGTLSYQIWYRPGGGQMINRDYLDHDHPEQTYNYLKRFGIKPEDFGIVHPLVEIMQKDFVGKSRVELIAEIVALRSEVNNLNRLLA